MIGLHTSESGTDRRPQYLLGWFDSLPCPLTMFLTTASTTTMQIPRCICRRRLLARSVEHNRPETICVHRWPFCESLCVFCCAYFIYLVDDRPIWLARQIRIRGGGGGIGKISQETTTVKVYWSHPPNDKYLYLPTYRAANYLLFMLRDTKRRFSKQVRDLSTDSEKLIPWLLNFWDRAIEGLLTHRWCGWLVGWFGGAKPSSITSCRVQ